MKKLIFLLLFSVCFFSCDLNEIEDNPENTYNEKECKLKTK